MLQLGRSWLSLACKVNSHLVLLGKHTHTYPMICFISAYGLLSIVVWATTHAGAISFQSKLGTFIFLGANKEFCSTPQMPLGLGSVLTDFPENRIHSFHWKQYTSLFIRSAVPQQAQYRSIHTMYLWPHDWEVSWSHLQFQCITEASIPLTPGLKFIQLLCTVLVYNRSIHTMHPWPQIHSLSWSHLYTFNV